MQGMKVNAGIRHSRYFDEQKPLLTFLIYKSLIIDIM